MENFIHQHSKPKNQKNLNEYYCMIGEEDFLDKENYPRCKDEASKNICAKKVIRTDGTARYSIKTSEDRKLLNPWSIFDPKDKKFLDSISRNQDPFIDVNYNVFGLYIKFLKTKNVAYLNNAEREM